MRAAPKVVEHTLHLVHAMIGNTDELEDLAKKNEEGEKPSQLPRLMTFLVGGYILFATLMMFNTLVAAMNSTYEACSTDAEKRWRLERVRIISSLESEMNASRMLQTAFWVEKKDEHGTTTRYLLETSNISERKVLGAPKSA